MLGGEATYTNLIVLGLTWPWFKPIIYRSQDKHADHYTTDAGWVIFSFLFFLSQYWLVRFMVFNATFNNISVITWQSVLLVEEIGLSLGS